LFHPNLTATRIWNAVKIMRAVDGILDPHQSDVVPKADMVASHLQRIVLHIVFQDPAMAGWESDPDSNARLPAAETLAERVFQSVVANALKYHPNEYLASLSKNFEKCTTLVERILGRESIPNPPGSGWLNFGPDDS
jgi:hypothetical protein